MKEEKKFDLKVFGIVVVLVFLSLLIIAGLIYQWCGKGVDFIQYAIEKWTSVALAECLGVASVGVGGKIAAGMNPQPPVETQNQ